MNIVELKELQYRGSGQVYPMRLLSPQLSDIRRAQDGRFNAKRAQCHHTSGH